MENGDGGGMKYEGYQTFRANELSLVEQERLRRLLQRELVEAMIRAVRDKPPTINLVEVELILRPNQDSNDWSTVADCGTCGTCGTSGGCGTCGTT